MKYELIRTKAFRLGLLSMAATPVAQTQQAKQGNPPNLVFIMADQYRTDDSFANYLEP